MEGRGREGERERKRGREVSKGLKLTDISERKRQKHYVIGCRAYMLRQ
jgi:hypothetical protein